MVITMNIKKILEKACIKYGENLNNHYVNSIKDDSRSVELNDVFFAIKGGQTDGKNYIEEAILKGAKTIIYEGETNKSNHNINYISVVNVKRVLALFCKIFFNDITKKIKLVGVTGTNGKTTISTLLYDYLSYSGYDPVLVGTSGIYFKDEHFHTSNTTPNIIETYTILKEAVKRGAQHLIMEVSSIGIRECRVLYFDFDIIIFTNLSHDHLDYHKNITDYKFSKAYILWSVENHPKKAVIINSDDENIKFFSSLIKSNIITYGISNSADYNATDVKKSLYQTSFNINIDNILYNVKTSLVGGFNIYNILSIIATVDFLDLDINSFIDFLKIYVSINGRMNKIIYNSRVIIIDFAHTPNGLINVLSNLKEFTNQKITVVIGCGGNRDISKRSLIAQIAIKYVDKVVFTTDNPRDEEPMDIINDMIKNLKSNKYRIILDRKLAIQKVLDESIHDEVIAILGKGSERNQIINGINYPFSDKEVVFNWINKNNEKNIK